MYTKKTNNLLNDRKLPDLIGYASVTSNIGEVNNKGVEISLRSTNIQRENFEWSTTFNLAYNKNTIKHLYGLMENVLDEEGNIIGQKEADDISKGYFIGHALDEKWGYKFLGVWQENEAEEAAKYNQVPGDPKLLDVDQNYKYNSKSTLEHAQRVYFIQELEFLFQYVFLFGTHQNDGSFHQQQCAAECNQLHCT